MDFETAKLSFVNLVSGLDSNGQKLFHDWLKDYVNTAADDVLDSEIAEARINLQVTALLRIQTILDRITVRLLGKTGSGTDPQNCPGPALYV
jgi:hypothetical protein